MVPINYDISNVPQLNSNKHCCTQSRLIFPLKILHEQKSFKVACHASPITEMFKVSTITDG